MKEELTEKEYAWKEMELLQAIIERTEGVRMKFRGWYIGLITAISAAFYTTKDFIDKYGFLIFCTALTIFFCMIESFYRLPESRAIQRSNDIEKFLRGETNEYSGPKIGVSLRPSGHRYIPRLVEFRYWLLFATYFAFEGIILLIFMAK